MLTKSEKQIMDLLWTVGEPLSCTEIVDRSEDKTWKDSYVHSLIKSLMKKGMVEIAGFELISRSYARKFQPAMTRDQYDLKALTDDKGKSRLPAVVSAFATPDADEETMAEIEKIIKDWKKSRK